MIDEYLNQTAIWYHKTGQDAYGKSTYAIPINIRCRFEGGMKLIKDKTGKDAVSQGTFYVLERIDIDDKLEYEGRINYILNFADIIGVDGDLVYRKVWI